MNTQTPQNQNSIDRPADAVVVSKESENVNSIDQLCRKLMRVYRDPASIAIADEITSAYRLLTTAEKIGFLGKLNNNYGVDRDAIVEAAKAYEQDPGFKTHRALARVVESPRQKLFRYLNTAPDGLETLILMRKDLLEFETPIRIGLASVGNDLRNLLQSWFNHGFLELKRIDWSSPASLLEKLTQYEAVHQISNWEDLRRRLQDDRRCYAFFHPSMPNEPLVFVEVALTNEISCDIKQLIAPKSDVIDPNEADTAMFYSISSCQKGLTRISFGGWLVKQVVDELKRTLPGLKTFSTLSPTPGFARWLSQKSVDLNLDNEASAQNQDELMRLMAHYLLSAKIDGRPVDSVARFHLGNGARLGAIHWMADSSEKAMENSCGMMVNCIYDAQQIQINRNNFIQHQIVAANSEIHSLAGQCCLSEKQELKQEEVEEVNGQDGQTDQEVIK